MIGLQQELFAIEDPGLPPPPAVSPLVLSGTEVHIGTSGYDLAGWRGVFYPPGLPPEDRLSYYATRHSSVEINCSFYRMPTRKLLAGMAERVPPGFPFSVKAYRGLTHFPEGGEAFLQFRRALDPLLDEGRLLAVLCQFPPWFREGGVTRSILKSFRSRLPDLPLAIELRHRSWACPATFRLLEDLDLGYCMVDLPRSPDLMPPIARLTSALGYLRLHSRNRDLWETSHRYDYRYSDAEILEWLARLKPMLGRARTIAVYFNNCHAAEAARNAERMRELLSLRSSPPHRNDTPSPSHDYSTLAPLSTRSCRRMDR